jgi:hypothetical protein
VVGHSNDNEISRCARNDDVTLLEGEVRKGKKGGCATLFSLSNFYKHTQHERHFERSEKSHQWLVDPNKEKSITFVKNREA